MEFNPLYHRWSFSSKFYPQEEPKWNQEKEEKYPSSQFYQPLRVTDQVWRDVSEELTHPVHATDYTPLQLLSEQHREKTNIMNLCVLYSHTHLSVPPPPSPGAPLHIHPASAPSLPTLQWINAFPCSSRPVFKSFLLPSINPHLFHRFRMSLVHMEFLPYWAIESNKKYLLTASDMFSI